LSEYINILITQRLQNDYISVLNEDDMLPTSLHVGNIEGQRLLGTSEREGLLVRFLRALYAEKDKNLHVIHLAEEHKLGDRAHDDEIASYGIHCIENTKGVKLIDVIEGSDKRDIGTTLIKSKSKSDFNSSSLKEHLNTIIKSASLSKVRVFIVGVRTDMNIKYLIYDLKYNYGIKDISVCSQLTTTSNRRTHYETLDFLSVNFGINVYDRVYAFYNRLGLSNFTQALIKWDDSRQTINFNDEYLGIFNTSIDLKNIVKTFFQDYKDITLTLLSEKHSEIASYGVSVVNWKYKKNTKMILRIGHADEISKEKKSYEMVEIFLPAKRPVIVDYLDLGEWAAVLYDIKDDNKFETFLDYFESFESYYDFSEFEQLTDKLILHFRRIHKRSKSRLDLLSKYYAFDDNFIADFSLECENVLGFPVKKDLINLKDFNLQIINPVNFFKTGKMNGIKVNIYFGIVHGNLMLSNILIGKTENNVYLMNFSSSKEGLVLDDIARLETDVLFSTNLSGQLSLKEIIRFGEFILSSPGLKLSQLPKEFENTAYKKLYKLLYKLRIFSEFITFGESSLIEYLAALIKHIALRMMHPTSSKLHKIFAFVFLALAMKRFLEENK
jgi:nicotinamidase-related amidase